MSDAPLRADAIQWTWVMGISSAKGGEGCLSSSTPLDIEFGNPPVHRQATGALLPRRSLAVGVAGFDASDIVCG